MRSDSFVFHLLTGKKLSCTRLVFKNKTVSSVVLKNEHCRFNTSKLAKEIGWDRRELKNHIELLMKTGSVLEIKTLGKVKKPAYLLRRELKIPAIIESHLLRMGMDFIVFRYETKDVNIPVVFKTALGHLGIIEAKTKTATMRHLGHARSFLRNIPKSKMIITHEGEWYRNYGRDLLICPRSWIL